MGMPQPAYPLLTDHLGSWPLVSLGDLCKQDRRLIEPSSELAGLPYLGLEHIESNTGRILLDLTAPAAAVQSVTFAFADRHVLYSKLRPYLNKVAVPDFAGRCTTELVPLLPEAGVSRRYLGWLLRRPDVVAHAMQEKTGARMPRANLDLLFRLKLPLPATLEEQELVVTTMEAQMQAVAEAHRACLEQLELIDQLGDALRGRFPASMAKGN